MTEIINFVNDKNSNGYMKEREAIRINSFKSLL